MNIAGFEYSLTRKSLEVYLSGCRSPHCAGCHNRSLWDFDKGTEWREYLQKYCSPNAYQNAGLLKNFMVMGGEPLDQDIEELRELIKELRHINPQAKVWLFTGKPEFDNKNFGLSIDFVKYGPYCEGRPSKYMPEYDLLLASDNQTILPVDRSTWI